MFSNEGDNNHMFQSVPKKIKMSVGILNKEIRRVSDPDKAQIIWDGIKVILTKQFGRFSYF